MDFFYYFKDVCLCLYNKAYDFTIRRYKCYKDVKCFFEIDKFIDHVGFSGKELADYKAPLKIKGGVKYKTWSEKEKILYVDKHYNGDKDAFIKAECQIYTYPKSKEGL